MQLRVLKEHARRHAGLQPSRSYRHQSRKVSVRFESRTPPKDESDLPDDGQLDDVSSSLSSDISSDFESDSSSVTSSGTITDVVDELSASGDGMSKMKVGGGSSPPPLSGGLSHSGRTRLGLESGTFEELRRAKCRGEPPGPPPKVRCVLFLCIFLSISATVDNEPEVACSWLARTCW